MLKIGNLEFLKIWENFLKIGKLKSLVNYLSKGSYDNIDWVSLCFLIERF